jgi:hypothetical protein
MIKLTLNPDSHPIARLYEKTLVIIGSCGSADLLLPEETLQEDHIRILLQDDRYTIINQANDPFVTVNGIPFGKKVLSNGDLIQVGQCLILFEEQNSSMPTIEDTHIDPSHLPTNAKDGPLADTAVMLPKILDKKIRPPEIGNLENTAVNPVETSTPSYVEELEALEQEVHNLDITAAEDIEEFDIEALMRQVEELEDISISPTPANEITEELEPLHSEHTPSDDLKENSCGSGSQNHPLSNDTLEEFAEKETTSRSPDNQQQKTDGFISEVDETHNLEIGISEEKAGEQDLFASQHSPSLSETTTSLPQKPRSFKDYYLTETEDENEGLPAEKQKDIEQTGKKSWKHWKFFFLISGVVLFLAALVAGIVYLNMTDKSEEEEARAIDGVSDVTMALAYAQVKHIIPQNQDWSDPEFLKNNLLAVLGPGYTPLFSLDSHGQFHGCSYILRIYTSTDQTHFLVIAQPAPSLLQWLIPKSAIIVDSAAMEIRRVNDLKALNRLLVNPGTLDGTNAVEVSNVVKQGELIPLSYLAVKSTHNGFTPPKALALVRAGAQDKIYNAPRYFRFGETFMKQAMSLSESASGTHEVEMLQEEIGSLAKYPNIVFYTSQGIQWAIQAQKALSTFVPQGKFLVGYLKYNIRGILTGSHLLMDDGLTDIAFEPKTQGSNVAAPALESDSSNTARSGSDKQTVIGDSDLPFSTLRNDSDRNHPLFLQLNALNFARQQNLKPFQDEIINLLHAHTQTYVGNFDSKSQELLANYENASRSFDQKMAKRINELTQEYSAIPLEQVMAYIEAAGLASFMKEKMKDGSSMAEGSISEQELDLSMMKILDSKDLAELDGNLEKIQKDLTLERYPETDKLIRYQNQARGLVLKKLEEFLFSPQGRLSQTEFKEENKPILTKILRSVWISDSAEMEFYQNEFDTQIHR